MKKILECLSGHDGVWVVGGAVRDLLLGVEPRDIDLLVHEGVALPLLALIEQHHNAKPFLIKEAFGVWRFQLGTLALDIATFTDTLESDLAKRDFTINAMALKIDDYLSGSAEQIIAPFMGKRHLELGIIEPVGPHSIMADPVRILRCARFQAERGMSSSLALNGQARSYAEKLKDCPGERLWSEVKLIMNAPFALRGLDWLDEIGALAVLFPEMEAEKGVVQNEFHHFEVFEHSRRALAHYLDIWEKADFLDPNVQECVANYQETTLMSNLAVYKLAAFLHDIGKPSAKGYRSDGKVTFY
ncbi:MAG: hypothetical protein Q8N36_00840, partial [bacterium]|nr:hypothetical protein [bacterium]